MGLRIITVWSQADLSGCVDPTTEPLSESSIRRLVASGLPPEAVRGDRTIDPDVLARYGWWISRGWIYGPPV